MLSNTIVGRIFLLLALAANLPALVNAEDKGKIVEFEVVNRDDNGARTFSKFRVQLHNDWAPLGVKRFEELTTANFWVDTKIFRVVQGFIAQWGINSNPVIQQNWKAKGPIQDDPVVASNDRGTVTFATSGANSRTTQIFINTKDNPRLDDQGFAPIGEVLPAGDGFGGMEVVDAFYAGYGESPEQGRITAEGEIYLAEEFPNLSYFVIGRFVNDEVLTTTGSTTTTSGGGDGATTTGSTTSPESSGGDISTVDVPESAAFGSPGLSMVVSVVALSVVTFVA
ncbi:hypothetical protein ACHAXR_001713 [Thalassiosira sp. AJA248-18]